MLGAIMNKHAVNLFYLCIVLSTTGSCAISHMDSNTNTFVYVHDHCEQRPDPFSRQWLYEVAAQNPHFVHYKKVRENREYFVKLLRAHIQKLEMKLSDGRYRMSFNKLATGVLANIVGGMFVYVGGYEVLCEAIESMCSPDKDYFEVGMMSMMSAIFGGVGGYVCFRGCNSIYRAFQYRQGVMERIARDKNILSKLESTSMTSKKDNFDAVSQIHSLGQA